MKMGTLVKNPCRRNGSGYTACSMCGKYYTSLGISRHWARCPNQPPKGEE